MKWYDLKQIKARNGILEVARELGLPLNGTSLPCLRMPCREHTNGQPTVRLDTRRNIFACESCGDFRGDVIDLVEWYTQLPKYDAIKYLADRVGIEASDSKPMKPEPAKTANELALVAEVYNFLIGYCSNIPDKGIAFLSKTGISTKTATLMRLAFIVDYLQVSDSLKKAFPADALNFAGLLNEKGNLIFFRQRLLIPFFKDGIPFAIRALSIDGRIQPQELSVRRPFPYPYNVDCLKNEKERVFLCANILDTLTLADQGLQAVGIPEFAGFQRRWIDLFKDRDVTIVFKGNFNGRTMAMNLELMLNDNGARADRIDLPQGQSVNSYFRTHARFFNQKRF